MNAAAGRAIAPRMNKLLASLVAPAALLLAAPAFAQQYGYGASTSQYQYAPPSSHVDNIGEEYQFVFGVDRVFGAYFDRTSTSQNQAETSTSETRVGLVGSPGSNVFTNQPRLALDYFVMEGLSVGGSLTYAYSTGKQTTKVGSTETSKDLNDVSGALLAPRVGYALQFDETFAIWPRGGLSMFFGTTTTSDVIEGEVQRSDSSVSFVDLSLEAPLTISPSDNVAFLVGPYLDLPLTGKLGDVDAKSWGFGLTAGFVGYY